MVLSRYLLLGPWLGPTVGVKLGNPLGKADGAYEIKFYINKIKSTSTKGITHSRGLRKQNAQSTKGYELTAASRDDNQRVCTRQ